ncbi:nuclear envelope pore membrane protein POM 121 [Corythoichthys intestinalis]|uniref:nuclear envelope pore membrane protein POM 121 n=1 Tax=Corythoichthys intestinalis TaxID=161448 RepID=UPI0025A4EAA2|nr:nuclear envelope pore membrane protein POM 121 [Corythoichthys intestinalis]XP_061801907.1 nuclear envelope pore membrane protein POM 121-like [Nerophis lumbriciformis]
MSPRERQLALLFALGLVSLALYFIPSFLYIVGTLVLCGVACLLCRGPPLPARLGLKPRSGLRVQPGYLRRFWDWWVSDVSVLSRRRNKHDVGGRELRGPSLGAFSQRPADAAVYRRGHIASDTFLFSPGDFLMGSYIAKAESPVGDFGRPRVVRNPREQLRERLSRPNHAVCTPNRRLSFAGEPSNTAGHFTITPQRHYPLQQPGTSPMGVVPPASWDGFRKKNILTPRNSLAARSPVTVKIARPDHSIPSLEHLSCAAAPRAPEDPCSRESVLKVLKDSRKREVEDANESFIAEHRNKRRRNDSSGSAHSAFEPLLPNGAPSQLVPKPGSLKRGIVSVAEEYTYKRSRTSSVSSASGVHTPGGTLGSKRNPIQSSYSSTQGLMQFKKPSAPSSPMSSPSSSRSQTPDAAAKRQREDDCLSPSSASSVRSERAPSDKAANTSKQTPVSVTTSTNSAGSGGNRKRKIQLVSSNRDDQITLPPPPELGYTITVKDLDEEKKAAINKIQKVLESPLPEPEKSTAPLTSTTPVMSTILAPKTTSATSPTPTLTLSSLLAAPLPKASSTATPVINLDPTPTPTVSNPLLEALKRKSPINATSAASTTTVSALTSSAPPPVLSTKAQTTTDSSKPLPVSESQPSSSGLGQSSAFAQVLGQVSKPANSNPLLPMASPFGMLSQVDVAVVSSASNPAPVTTAPLSLATPLLASGFKPIFAVSTTASTPSTITSPESKPPVQTFKPIFGSSFAPPPCTSSTSTSTVVSSTTGAGFAPPPYTTSATTPISSSLFGTATSSAVTVSLFPGLTPTAATTTTSATTIANPAAQPAAKSMFGAWSAPSSTSASTTSVQAPTTGFQFGAVTTTTAALPAAVATTAPALTTSAFTFGAVQPSTQVAGQNVFSFGQTTVSQNTTTASFGGFTMAAATTANATTATTNQATFTFGKPSFLATAPQATFNSTTVASKPFTFGASVAPAVSASNPTPTPFNFGGAAAAAPAAATVPSSFVTPTKPAFGGGSTAFAFGGTTAPSAAPSFGQAAQTQSTPSFTFGGAVPQQTPSGPTPQASGGFNFGAAVSQPQFGTPVANNPAPQMGSFNFGAAATSTPNFGQNAAAAAGLSLFGSQGFNASPFGSTATPSFSIGAGPKATGARQRLQARRQHNRKK